MLLFENLKQTFQNLILYFKLSQMEANITFNFQHGNIVTSQTRHNIQNYLFVCLSEHTGPPSKGSCFFLLSQSIAKDVPLHVKQH